MKALDRRTTSEHLAYLPLKTCHQQRWSLRRHHILLSDKRGHITLNCEFFFHFIPGPGVDFLLCEDLEKGSPKESFCPMATFLGLCAGLIGTYAPRQRSFQPISNKIYLKFCTRSWNEGHILLLQFPIKTRADRISRCGRKRCMPAIKVFATPLLEIDFCHIDIWQSHKNSCFEIDFVCCGI